MKRLLLLLLFFQSCIGWGDIFLTQEHIIGNYFLVESDDGFCKVSFKVSNGFIGRNPPATRVLAYAFNDSVLAMKVTPCTNDTPYYYAINMNKDRDIAERNEYEMGRIDTTNFKNSWIESMNLSFKEVKQNNQ